MNRDDYFFSIVMVCCVLLFFFGIFQIVTAYQKMEPIRQAALRSVSTSSITRETTIAVEAKKCHDQGGDYMAYWDQGEKELTQRCKVSSYIDLTK